LAIGAGFEVPHEALGGVFGQAPKEVGGQLVSIGAGGVHGTVLVVIGLWVSAAPFGVRRFIAAFLGRGATFLLSYRFSFVGD
jgi:hypothetical protein